MRILFFSHYFPPEVNAPANRTHDHCREWVRAGHEVHVVTCVPSHPRGIPFPGYKSCWYQREMVNGIHVHRVWTYLASNQGKVLRIVNYLSFVPSAVFRGLGLGRFDVVMATSPQFFCAVAGWLCSRLKRTPWIFELRDLWPESISAVGAIQRGVLTKALERFELHLYRSASAVVCLTESFVSNLRSRGIDPAKLFFVPNGVDPGYWLEESDSREVVRRGLGIASEAVLVSYVGTIGMAHGLGTLIAAARETKERRPDIRFAVVGDGAEKDAVESLVQKFGLANVCLTGLVERDRARDILRASDVTLVLLRKAGVFETVIPSKMLEAFAAGCPVVLGVGGEARRILEAANAGIVIDPESTEQLMAAIERLADRPEERLRLGESGRRYVAAKFDRSIWARRLLERLQVEGAKGMAA